MSETLADQPATAPTRAPETNGLGLAGFICSLVGLCAGGLLSPIGLILSLVALGKQPRGFAIAGVVLGALGSCGIIFTIIIFFPALFIMMAGAIGLAAAFPQLETQYDLNRINTEVIAYQDRTGALPMTIDDLSIDDAEVLTDPWGAAYIYELAADGLSYRIYSWGEDGVAGTADDVEADLGNVINMD